MYFKIFVYVFRDFYMEKQPFKLSNVHLNALIRQSFLRSTLVDTMAFDKLVGSDLSKTGGT